MVVYISQPSCQLTLPSPVPCSILILIIFYRQRSLGWKLVQHVRTQCLLTLRLQRTLRSFWKQLNDPCNCFKQRHWGEPKEDTVLFSSAHKPWQSQKLGMNRILCSGHWWKSFPHINTVWSYHTLPVGVIWLLIKISA